MAHPKRKISKSRGAKRRAHYKVDARPQLLKCDNCGEAKVMHRACPACGHYRGRAVIESEDFA